MADTERTEAELLTLFANNDTGAISPQDARDLIVSVPGLASPGLFDETQYRRLYVSNSGQLVNTYSYLQGIDQQATDAAGAGDYLLADWDGLSGNQVTAVSGSLGVTNAVPVDMTTDWGGNVQPGCALTLDAGVYLFRAVVGFTVPATNQRDEMTLVALVNAEIPAPPNDYYYSVMPGGTFFSTIAARDDASYVTNATVITLFAPLRVGLMLYSDGTVGRLWRHLDATLVRLR